MNQTLLLFTLFFFSCLEKKDDKNILKISPKEKSAVINIPTKKTSGEITNLHLGCGFNYIIDNPKLKLSLPNEREISEIQNILLYSGIPMNFEIYSANIENAVATIIDNKRYIIYDPKLLSFADRHSNSYWSSMSILAHEIGHHLSGHTMKNKIDSHKRELEADKFSGFILYKMGATIEQATYAISMFGTEEETDTHPSKFKRIEAITNGWNEASSQISKSAIPPINEFNDEISGLEYNLEDFYNENEILENHYKIDELGPFVGYVISNKYQEGNLYSMIVEIVELPKTGTNNLPSIFRKNKRVEIYLVKPENAPNATRGNFEYIIKPGNKLLFKIHQEGNAGYPYPNYIKILERKQ